MQAAETTAETRWLQRLAGEWTWDMEAEGGPGEPPIRESGPESVRMLGPWAICESTGRTPEGAVATSLMSIGYDLGRERFVGTFLSSMMAYLWVYDGTLDADGRVLTLAAEGPSYTEEGGMANYRDTIEFLAQDQRVHTSAYQAADGTWHPFMTTHYRRIG